MWKNERYEAYDWRADGKLLAKGVCVSDRTQKHLVPDPGKTKVISKFEHEQVRYVNSRRQKMSLDLTLTMKWWDPNIKYNKAKDQTNQTEIILSPSAINKIWTPDLAIKNLTSLKIKDEWISLRTSKVLLSDEANQHDAVHNHPANVEITYEIKASIFCQFDHKKYPMDEQHCNLTIGSSSFGSIFMLDQDNDLSQWNPTYVASNFLVSSRFFDDLRHNLGSNSIGIQFKLVHTTTPYLVKYYIPCNAIVIISMMGFMIPLSAIPGRIALLVTQFLTLTNLFIYEMLNTLLKKLHDKHLFK